MNKVNRINRNRLMIAGLDKNYTAKQTVLVDGVATLQPQVIAVLQAPSDAADVTAAAEAAYHKAVADENAANAAADATFLSLKNYFLLVNKKTPEVLADYGLEPVVKKVPTAATKAAAAVKQQATRAARGTKGPKQRKAITASAAPAPAPATPVPAPATPVTTPKS
jgi:phage-related minor tail protein